MKKLLMIGTLGFLLMVQCGSKIDVNTTATGAPDSNPMTTNATNVTSTPTIDPATATACKSLGQQVKCVMGSKVDACQDKQTLQTAIVDLSKMGITPTGLPADLVDCHLACVSGSCQTSS